jgi:ActR/RegA family two-component response regulator
LVQEGWGPKSVVIAHSDERYAALLGAQFIDANLTVRICGDGRTLQRLIAAQVPDLLVTDLRLTDGPSIARVERLCRQLPQMRIDIVTSYGSISSAVRCERMGVHGYFHRRPSVEELILGTQGCTPVLEPVEQPLRLERAIWEYVNRVLDESGSVTVAASVLGVDRRSLRRMLGKYPPRA